MPANLHGDFVSINIRPFPNTQTLYLYNIHIECNIFFIMIHRFFGELKKNFTSPFSFLIIMELLFKLHLKLFLNVYTYFLYLK